MFFSASLACGALIVSKGGAYGQSSSRYYLTMDVPFRVSRVLCEEFRVWLKWLNIEMGFFLFDFMTTGSEAWQG